MLGNQGVITLMSVKAADFVLYIVSDVGKAVPFYRDVLGLKLAVFKPEWQWAEFDMGNVTLCLFGENPGAPMRAGKGGVAVAFGVENFEDAVARLTENGHTPIFGPNEGSTCREPIFLDPDGNPFLVHKRHDETNG